jgi:predicted Zn-dependent peptidase
MARPAAALALALAAAAVPAAETAPDGPPPPLPSRPTPAPPARELRLANGLRVVVVEHHRRPLVVATLVLPRGTLSDPAGAPGATWLAVHLAGDFREVNDTGDTLHEEKSFRRQVVELGGSARLLAAPDLSMVEVSGYGQDAARLLRLLADTVLAPRHGESSFKQRRDLALDALEDLETSDPEAMERVLAEAAFGAGHPYARPEQGTTRSLTRMGLEDVVDRQKALFVPDGATLLVVGDVAPREIFAAARAAFGGWKGRAPPPPVLTSTAAPRRGAAPGLLRRSPASTLVTCAARPVPPRARDAALDVLAQVLGGGGSSRLAVALRERAGLSYAASATVVRRRHARALLACSPLAADRAGEGLRLFREALEAVRTGPITEAELARARAARLGELEATWDDLGGVAGAWLEAVALGDGLPHVERERAAVAAVTVEEVAGLARELLAPGALRWIVSGEPAVAARAAAANGLGTPRALALDR